MSKIQEALKRLQSQGKPGASPRKYLRNRIDVADAVSVRKTRGDGELDDDVEVHHVNLEKLIDHGLLPSAELVQITADEFRRIKRPLIKTAFDEVHSVDEHANVLMITSAYPRAGKTFCATNLAISIALERDLNVLLVDADVAKPHITRAFDLEENVGLIDLLADDEASVRSVLVRTDCYDIQVLPAGRPHSHATELLASARMSEIVDELARRYPDRIIIIDSPPLLVTSEAQAIANQVGQIVLVIEFGKTGHQSVSEMQEMLDSEKAINVIINKSQQITRGSYYGEGYGYYFDTESAEDEKEQQKNQT